MLGAAQATLLGVQREVPWSPASEAGLMWWADFADGDTVFTDNGVTKATDGGLIYRVNDKSGNNRHWVQSTSGSRPTYKTGANGLNGKGIALSTDGNRHLPNNNVVTGNGPYSIYIVAKTPTISGYLWIGLGVYDRTHCRLGASLGKATLAVNAYAYVGTVNIPTTVPYILTNIIDANAQQYLNGGGDGMSGTWNSGHWVSGFTRSGLNLFAQWDGILKLVTNSYIAEVLCYAAGHDATTRAKIRDYLNTKWAVY